MSENCRIESCPYTHEIADLAVKKAFGIIGVDIDKPKEVEDFRNIIRFSALAQKLVFQATIIMMGTLITTLLLGVTNWAI